MSVPPTDPAQLRRDYRREALRRADLAADPVAQFRRWFDQAVASELCEPNAMVLGTSDGVRPSARTVLLKAFDARGFVFFTHYDSRKATEIAAHPQVSLLFPWYGLERQVAILGRAERISTAESLAYFLSRPIGSRLGAWVSQQSAVISSRSILEMQWEAMQRGARPGASNDWGPSSQAPCPVGVAPPCSSLPWPHAPAPHLRLASGPQFSRGLAAGGTGGGHRADRRTGEGARRGCGADRR